MSSRSFRFIDKKYQDLIRQGVNKDEKSIEVFRNMRRIYGNKSPCKKTVNRYWRQMKAEKEEINRRNQDLTVERLERLESFRTRTTPAATTTIPMAAENVAESEDDLEVIYIKPETGILQGPQPEQILGDFIQNGQRYFLVKWKTQDENTIGEMILFDFELFYAF